MRTSKSNATGINAKVVELSREEWDFRPQPDPKKQTKQGDWTTKTHSILLPELFLHPPGRRSDVAFSQRDHAGHRQPGARAGGAVAPGVHRAAGWACEAGLRERRSQALARRERRALSHGQRHVVGR